MSVLAQQRPGTIQLIFSFVLSILSSWLKGVYYFYLLLSLITLAIGFFVLFFSALWVESLNQLLQQFRPQLIALGVPEHGSFSYYGPIPDEILAASAIIFSVLGYAGTRAIEWLQKGKMTNLQEAKLIIGLCVAANVSSSLVVGGLALGANGLPAGIGAFFLALISSAIFSIIALACYGLGRALNAVSQWVVQGKGGPIVLWK